MHGRGLVALRTHAVVLAMHVAAAWGREAARSKHARFKGFEGVYTPKPLFPDLVCVVTEFRALKGSRFMLCTFEGRKARFWYHAGGMIPIGGV